MNLFIGSNAVKATFKVAMVALIVVSSSFAIATLMPSGFAHADLDFGAAEWGGSGDCCGDSGLDFGAAEWGGDGCVDCYYNSDTGCFDCFSGDEYLGSYCDLGCGGGYEYDDSCYDCYSTGGGYTMGGGSYTPSYSTPRPQTGGGYWMVTPSVSGGGSQTQNQDQSQTQTTTVTNTNTNVNVNNNTAIAVVQIPGNSNPSYPSYPSYPSTPSYPAPYCSIYQAQSYGSYGARPVYLSWSSSNAQSAYLSNYGSVAVNGSQTVYPTYSTTYTLTVYGYNGQQATCQTTVQMNSYVPPVPTTPYVSLTQIPYTGFDFGTVGNAMYWAGLAIVALGGAYLAVFFIPQVALANVSRRKFQPIVAPKAPLLMEKEAAEVKFANLVAGLNKKATADTMAIVHEQGSLPKIVVDRS